MDALPPSTAPSPRWPWPAAPTAWTSSAACCRRPPPQPDGVLVLEIGHERPTSRPPSPRWTVVWLPTSAGDDQVLLLTREAQPQWRRPHDHSAQPDPAPRRPRWCLHGASVTLQPRREGRPGGPQRRRQVQPVFAAHRPAAGRRRRRGDAAHAGAWARWRRTCPRPTRRRHRLRAAGRPAADGRLREPLWPPPRPPATAMPWRDAHMALEEAGAFDARARAQALLLGLGFKTDQLDAPVNSFSGGWRMRLQLARALMCPADLLLLDEPTNHLDLDALVWLEAWLQALRGHDDRHQPRPRVPRRDHQASRCTWTNAKLTRYGGNYTAFEELRAERMASSRPRSASSRTRSRTCSASSTASRPRPARPSRRKAASRRWRAWRSWRRCWPTRLPVRVPRAANLPNPMLAIKDLSCGYGSTPTHRAHITAPCWPASASASWAPTARASRRWSRPSRMPAAAGRHGDRRQGPGDRLLRAAGAGRAARRRRRCSTWCGWRATPVGRRRREQELRNFLGQFRFTGDMVHQPWAAVRRRKGAPGAGHDRLAAPQPAAAGRTHQPPGPDHARGAVDGAQRVRRHGDAGQPRPRAAARGVRRVLAGGARRVQPFDGDLDDYQRWLLDARSHFEGSR
jgi:hypothetical protein